MTLNRWDPVRDLLDFQEKVNRLMHCRNERPRAQRVTLRPLADMIETPDSYILHVELPGVGRENITVEAEHQHLRVFGCPAQSNETGIAVYHTVERNHGSFERSFNLPSDADVESADARYVDGILEIRLPKREHHWKRSLTVICLRG